MVTYRIRKMIAWGMAVTMTAGMTNVLTGCGAEREGQAVETSQVEDTSQAVSYTHLTLPTNREV